MEIKIFEGAEFEYGNAKILKVETVIIKVCDGQHTTTVFYRTDYDLAEFDNMPFRKRRENLLHASLEDFLYTLQGLEAKPSTSIISLL